MVKIDSGNPKFNLLILGNEKKPTEHIQIFFSDFEEFEQNMFIYKTDYIKTIEEQGIQ